MTRLDYWRRVFSAYVLRRNSQLTFWHETPESSGAVTDDPAGPYYMTFRAKADYPGPYDPAGIPLLDYRGKIGQRHNPIAVAQYALGNYNLFLESGDPERRHRCLAAADWLVENLTPNAAGVPVWNHDFDWEYRETLTAPWHSGLAQGQGVSALARAYACTGEARYLDAASHAFESMTKPISDGGVLDVDAAGDTWIEEYIVSPPTHILNGFIWALWGVRDFRLLTGRQDAADLWDACVATLKTNLGAFDTGYWTLYDLSAPGRLKMIASPFYHQLHIVQAGVFAEMTGDPEFAEASERWAGYAARRLNRLRSLGQKAVFKLLRY